jgi:hypothetical protein
MQLFVLNARDLVGLTIAVVDPSDGQVFDEFSAMRVPSTTRCVPRQCLTVSGTQSCSRGQLLMPQRTRG